MISDEECVDCLCQELGRAGELLGAPFTNSGWRTLVAVSGENFDAEARITPNYEREDGSCVVEVRFLRTGPGRAREKFIYLRPGNSNQRLQSPRVWRRLGTRRRTGGTEKGPQRHKKLSLLESSRDIYWVAGLPSGDLRAQVIIALLQLGLLPRVSKFQASLAKYVRGFRMALPRRLHQSERHHVRDTTALIVADKLINYWCYPEDYRAFRKYVANAIKIALREYAETTGKIVGVLVSNSRDQFNIQEAATVAGCGTTYIYKLIRSGRLQALREKGKLLLAKAELQRLQQVLESRHKLRQARIELEQNGKTPSAARKAIYRRHGCSPKVGT